MKMLYFKTTPADILHNFTAAENVIFDDRDKVSLGTDAQTLARLDGIFLQVDPILERLIMPSAPHLLEVTMEEMLVSVTAGEMLIKTEELLWIGTAKDEVSRGDLLKEVALRVRCVI